MSCSTDTSLCLTKRRKFSVIVAAEDKTRGIGFQNGIPWKIPRDMRFFTAVTSQRDPKDMVQRPDAKNAIVAGRITWESIGKPLPNRVMAVVSSTLVGGETFASFPSLTAALDHLWNDEAIDKVFVIGGTSIYEEAVGMPECEEIYMTRLKLSKDYQFDRFFPELPDYFELTSMSPEINTDEGQLVFQLWKRQLP